MMKISLLIISLFLFTASPVLAEEQIDLAKASDLYATCMDGVYQSDILPTSAYCKAFIQGVVEEYKHITSDHNVPKQYCLPSAISVKELVGIYIKSIDDNPMFLDKSAVFTLNYALSDSFPCPTVQDSK